MQLPRVLIFGQPFNYTHGGGITLSNLFKGWDPDKIAVLATGHVMYRVTTDICKNYYQLGFDEFKWKFPFNCIQRKFPSGPLSVISFTKQNAKSNKSFLRNILVNRVFYPFLEWLGLFHSLAKLRLTPGLIKWLADFNPELLYIQVSTRETILFAAELTRYLKVPSVIHIMDDWPSTLSKRGIFSKYWHDKIDIEFRSLLDRVDMFLSISDAMSYEYIKRYNKNFIPFHNPIDVQPWTQNAKTVYKLNEDHTRVLFSGRIGIGTTESLLDLAQAVESLSQTGVRIKLYVQSPSRDRKIHYKLRKFQSLIINPVADYSDLPGIYSKADILAITNDFNNKSINYLRYSMPTKASEYMISGTPVLVYSHAGTAVTRFFSDNRCGYCVMERNLVRLKEALLLLIEDDQLRHELGVNAVRVAKELFDAEIVRTKFQTLIKNTSLMD